MLNLMKFKYWYFAISLLVILPGLYFLMRYGLKLSIDFTGGSIIEVKNFEAVKPSFAKNNIPIVSVQKTSNGYSIIRTKPITTATKNKIFGTTKVERFETVGPVIGKELTIKSLQAIGIASIAIVLYIAYAFREIPKPYKSWKFGVSAVIALLHDVLVVVGVFAILGYFWNVEVDALFVTALLTVIGFSVHDTIVVFDRVRENLRKDGSRMSFESVANESLLQTLGRSLTTSLTVLFTLFALILFGGESIRWFCVALFVGIASGTYSSIFNATPLLVIWEKKN